MTDFKRQYKFTKGSIRRYATVTKDGNKLHDQGDHSIAMGTHIAAIMRDASGEFVKTVEPDFLWADQKALFHLPVPAGTTADVSISLSEPRQGIYAASVEMSVLDNKVAESTVTYQQKRPRDSLDLQSLLSLDQNDPRRPLDDLMVTGDGASIAAECQGRVGGLALSDLAIGYISPALYARGQHIVNRANEEGKDPLYARQHFTAYEALGGLKAGNMVYIIANPDDMKERTRGDITICTVPVTALNEDGNCLYKATLKLGFEKLADVLARLKLFQHQ